MEMHSDMLQQTQTSRSVAIHMAFGNWDEEEVTRLVHRYMNLPQRIGWQEFDRYRSGACGM